MKYGSVDVSAGKEGRSPYGERGLKSGLLHHFPIQPRRSPYGERGLKFVPGKRATKTRRRSPYGERGLKYTQGDREEVQAKSLPVRGAWIEICKLDWFKCLETVAPRTGSVD